MPVWLQPARACVSPGYVTPAEKLRCLKWSTHKRHSSLPRMPAKTDACATKPHGEHCKPSLEPCEPMKEAIRIESPQHTRRQRSGLNARALSAAVLSLFLLAAGCKKEETP